MAVTVDSVTNELTFFVNEAYGLSEAQENEEVFRDFIKRCKVYLCRDLFMIFKPGVLILLFANIFLTMGAYSNICMVDLKKNQGCLSTPDK